MAGGLWPPAGIVWSGGCSAAIQSLGFYCSEPDLQETQKCVKLTQPLFLNDNENNNDNNENENNSCTECS